MIDTLFHQLATAFCLRSGGQPRTKRRNGGRRRECDDCGWSVPSLRSLQVCGPALVTLTISEPLRLRARKDVPLGILAAPAVHLWSAQPGVAGASNRRDLPEGERSSEMRAHSLTQSEPVPAPGEHLQPVPVGVPRAASAPL